MFSRREFLKASGIMALAPYACTRAPSIPDGVIVNDVHSMLNPTLVERVVTVDSLQTIEAMVSSCRRAGKTIAISGGRHAMVGQQFAAGAWLLDSRNMNRVLELDEDKGMVEIEAGIQWPDLIEHLLRVQTGPEQWGIIQKQTGADRLTIGGAVSANAHGRVLTRKPMVGDVEALTIVGPDGRTIRCSRDEAADLFRLAVGGYGLFGIIYSIKLRLSRRQKIRRVVEVRSVDGLMEAFERRIADGFLYGDFQFSIDDRSDDFLRKGVFSCYEPVDPGTPMPVKQGELSKENWRALLLATHADKGAAFRNYSDYYLTTNGQVYWSDTHQTALYEDGYHSALDLKLKAGERGTEMITEIYIPRDDLESFLREARLGLRSHGANVIYGTIRLIERDDETFLAWARNRYACVIFNLHVDHSPEGLAMASDAFRGLIDMAARHGGSYFLTYHRYARKDQVLQCYPQFPEFLRLKRRHDPDDLLQSDWYRHYRTVFADAS